MSSEPHSLSHSNLARFSSASREIRAPNVASCSSSTAAPTPSTDRPPKYDVDHLKIPTSNDELRTLSSRLVSDPHIPPGVRKRALGNVLVKYASALATGRICGEVVVVLLGPTGAGKSRTVNKLVGANLLVTGRYASTTKEVQRVTVPAVQRDVQLDLSFDDTPGLDDTTLADRAQNDLLFRRYADAFCPRGDGTNSEEAVSGFLDICAGLGHDMSKLQNIAPVSSRSRRRRVYPNAVLVTASWSSVKYDAQNDPSTFTSDVGRSLQYLFRSGLYDSERPNVVVVVTHALAGYDTDCQDTSEAEAAVQWKEDALVKEAIIQEIAAKVFGAGNVVPVAFVENGSSEKALKRFRSLPNGEQSHRNLFYCLKSLFERNDGCGSDLQGLHSLGSIICGEILYKSSSTVARSVIGDELPEVQDNMSAVSLSSTLRPPSISSDALDSLARLVLGTTINPVTGKVGGGRAVMTSELRIRQAEDFRFSRLSLSGAPPSMEKQLNIPFAPRALHDFDYQGPDGLGYRTTTVYAVKEIAVATINTTTAHVSSEVLTALSHLPPWSSNSPRTVKLYHAFFHRFGTHFIRSAALGGFAAFALSHQRPPTLADVAHYLQTGQGTVPFDLDFETLRCEGGDAAADALAAGARSLFDNGQACRGEIWELRKARWMEALRRDPVFLMNEVATGFEWIHNAAGLPADVAHSLREASRWYVADADARTDAGTGAEETKVTDFSVLSGLKKAYDCSESLPRTELRNAIESSVEDSINWVSAIMDRVIDHAVKGLVVAGTVAVLGAALILLA